MTPTLAQALSQIAPQYNAAQHKRAAERMVQDMQKTAHTPGPWHCEDHTEVIARVPSPDSPGRFDTLTICRAVDVEIYHDNRAGSTEANARLLASAPDLLRALEEVLRCCVTPKGLPDLGKGRTTEQQEAMCAARAAIAKAKGGAQ